MGFMVAYNESSNASTYAGRKTAAKVVIYETDGCPNTTCSGNLSGGYYQSIGGSSFNQTLAGLQNSQDTAKTSARTIVRQFVFAVVSNGVHPGLSSVVLYVYVLGTI